MCKKYRHLTRQWNGIMWNIRSYAKDMDHTYDRKIMSGATHSHRNAQTCLKSLAKVKEGSH